MRFLFLAALLLASTARAASAPEWVATGGLSPKYPMTRFITGYSLADINGALQEARTLACNAAKGEVASTISARIEHALASRQTETKAGQGTEIEAMTRVSAEEQLSGLTCEYFADDKRVYALAVLEREPAAAAKLQERDKQKKEAKAQLASGEKAEAKKNGSEALKAYLGARLAASSAAVADSSARAISSKGAAEPDGEIPELLRQSDAKVQAQLNRTASTLSEAVDALAFQLRRTGVNSKAKITLAPLTFERTSFSSVFGRQIADELERTLAAAADKEPAAAQNVVLTGAYSEQGDAIRIALLARDVNGRAVGSATAIILKSAVPAELPLKPQNLEEALKDQHILADGELIEGKLRVEVWTNHGRGPLVLNKGDTVKFFFRVNQPAYLQITDLLPDGTKAVLSRGYYIDASKVNMTVEFPKKFRVSEPFGVEQLHVAAFTKEPPELKTVTKQIGSSKYELVEDAKTLVRFRGLVEVDEEQQIAERRLTMTTLP
jgi:hypothetical protein